VKHKTAKPNVQKAMWRLTGEPTVLSRRLALQRIAKIMHDEPKKRWGYKRRGYKFSRHPHAEAIVYYLGVGLCYKPMGFRDTRTGKLARRRLRRRIDNHYLERFARKVGALKEWEKLA